MTRERKCYQSCVQVAILRKRRFQGPGLKLDGVVPGSPAEKAGLKAGDILTHLGDDEVNGLGGFSDLLKKLEPGNKAALQLKETMTLARKATQTRE